MKIFLMLVFPVLVNAIELKVTKDGDKFLITKYKMATKEDGTSVSVEDRKYSIHEQFLVIEKQRLNERIAEIDLILAEIAKLK